MRKENKNTRNSFLVEKRSLPFTRCTKKRPKRRCEETTGFYRWWTACARWHPAPPPRPRRHRRPRSASWPTPACTGRASRAATPTHAGTARPRRLARARPCGLLRCARPRLAALGAPPCLRACSLCCSLVRAAVSALSSARPCRRASARPCGLLRHARPCSSTPPCLCA
jgi:hypothetical protein